MKWHPITETPPDKELVVKDDLGNQGIAIPTWYPFDVVPNPKNPGKWGSNIIPCEPYWDGNWMVKSVGLDNPIKGNIIKWREFSLIDELKHACRFVDENVATKQECSPCSKQTLWAMAKIAIAIRNLIGEDDSVEINLCPNGSLDYSVVRNNLNFLMNVDKDLKVDYCAYRGDELIIKPDSRVQLKCLDILSIVEFLKT